eukprot:TRINITY_DN9264_c0_g1_i1.p2 TRINITY_DN9264_c0_g1~~TRINITY_DN9264_c0_g1_i1.p2  ORF type:complete len:134 (+),score=17.49 TRINITY_DN9264_c0_g1_i1:301-702(+)
MLQAAMERALIGPALDQNEIIATLQGVQAEIASLHAELDTQRKDRVAESNALRLQVAATNARLDRFLLGFTTHQSELEQAGSAALESTYETERLVGQTKASASATLGSQARREVRRSTPSDGGEVRRPCRPNS